MANETISIETFRAAHKALGHLVIGMSAVPANLDSADVPERVPGWVKCLTCEIVCDEPAN